MSTTMASLGVLSGAVLTGVASYALYFHRYEQHLYAVPLMVGFLASFAVMAIILWNLCDLTVLRALQCAASISISFLTGAFGSTLFWRIFMNPLNRFPGPYAARISSLYWSSKLVKFDAYLKLAEAHKKYGRFVRVGPNDLSITHPDAVELALGTHAKAIKAPWYDMVSWLALCTSVD